MVRVFLSAGEASGDAYGAALVRALRRPETTASIQPHAEPWDGDSLDRVEAVMALEESGVEVTEESCRAWVASRGNVDSPPSEPLEFSVEGMGGVRMAREGVTLHADTSTWGAISIVQSLAVVPRALRGFLRARKRLSSGPPGVFIPIDFGWVNVRLARRAKERGWKVVYFIPPGSWRRDRQGRDLPAITDAVVTPFPWSEMLLKDAGANAFWFGHPIKELLRESRAEEVRRDQVAVLPGSRKHEISENLPAIAASLPDLPAEFALAPSVDMEQFRETWRRLAPNRTQDQFTVGETARVLARSRAGIVCSGTATLEAALSGCPMVVIYRVSRSMEIEAKVIGFKRPKYIALPNILLERDVVPELVQEDATPEAIREHLAAVLADGPRREAQIAAFRELDAMLGGDQAIQQTADLIRGMMSA